MPMYYILIIILPLEPQEVPPLPGQQMLELPSMVMLLAAKYMDSGWRPTNRDV
jgi:hypothetical protein